ncbi:putative lipoprotein [Burkholderia pseudomallei Pakistan 9]|nr:putative lipoprotein [Burkholderia pseudomallei Pakistan 9]
MHETLKSRIGAASIEGKTEPALAAGFQFLVAACRLRCG